MKKRRLIEGSRHGESLELSLSSLAGAGHIVRHNRSKAAFKIVLRYFHNQAHARPAMERMIKGRLGLDDQRTIEICVPVLGDTKLLTDTPPGFCDDSQGYSMSMMLIDDILK